MPGYLEEIGAAASTYRDIRCAQARRSRTGAGPDVPFYLRTGKRLPARVSEIVVAFKPIPHSIFPKDAGAIHANRLVMRLQPDEGVRQWIMIKDPGPGGMRVRHVPLDMSFADAFQVRNPDAYERLLLDVIRGNQTLFMRRDEVEAAWRWVDPIREAWERVWRGAETLHRRQLGAVGGDRADRARRPDVARGLGQAATTWAARAG